MRTLYRALLRFYPASFRAEYGAELLRTFEESQRGRSSVSSALAAITDVVPNALLAHRTILGQDLRSALRTIRHSRAFALTVILVTALGVGANTATFSVTDFVLLRPLPYPHPEALVRLCEGPREGGGWGCMNELSPANFRDVRLRNTSFSELGAFTGTAVNLSGVGDPVRVSGTRISTEAFSVLGVAPSHGRIFDNTNSGGRDADAVILGHSLWQSQFGGDPRVVGSTIRLDGVARVVIGIMPREFLFPSADVQLWLPLVLGEQDFENRTNTYLQSIGRLKPGVTFEQARADVSRIAVQLAREFPETNRETGFSFFRQRDDMSPRYRIMLLALCGASLCLLLLTGANLANLFLARAASRERELAVRAALGAGRDRLIRQMLTESMVLALLGGIAGVLVAVIAVPLLSHLIPGNLPLADRPRVDLRVLSIAGVFAALTGVGFGLIPALRVGGRTGFAALQSGSRTGGGRRQRLRTALVAIEVMVSVVLLISSGLLVRAVLRVQSVDAGIDASGVVTLRTALTSARYDSAAQRDAFYRDVLSSVRSMPGVQAAGYTSGLPMVMTGGLTGVEVAGQAPLNRRTNGASWRIVTPQLLAALGVPLTAGRDFNDGDVGDAQPVAVVSESFVERYWPGQSGIGKSFRMRDQERFIVGVVRDVKVRGLERTSEPQLYLPSTQLPGQVGDNYIPKDLVIRTTGSASSILPTVRGLIRRLDPEQPISDVRTLTDLLESQTSTRRAQLNIIGALALVALLLTGVGIHGLLAFTVAERSHEIGVRMALGAEPLQVARMIIGEAARLALWGGIPGLIVAYGAARAMNVLLFGVGPGDPTTIAAGVVIVMVVTICGALVPAYRAVRVSPLHAMRYD
jgi:predicted permease